MISSTTMALSTAAAVSNVISTKIGIAGVGPYNEYDAYVKNGQVTGYVQTGTKGGDIFDKVTYIDLDRAPSRDGVWVENLSVVRTDAVGPFGNRVSRGPGYIHYNHDVKASGGLETIDLTDFMPGKTGLKIGGGLILAGLKRGAYSDDLVKAAQKLYPNKAGKIELHHPYPKYMGGAGKQTLVPLDAAYHQQITNEFFKYWPKKIPGQPKVYPTAQQAQEIMQKVYSKFPLPGS